MESVKHYAVRGERVVSGSQAGTGSVQSSNLTWTCNCGHSNVSSLPGMLICAKDERKMSGKTGSWFERMRRSV